MKFNWKLILSIVLTSIVIGTGFNQVFLEASVGALHQHQHNNNSRSWILLIALPKLLTPET
jgi:multisubunit Na+/H+ antiporter MnhC subunit